MSEITQLNRGYKQWQSDFFPLTYVGVAERVLGVRQGARTALRQPVNVQAAEDEQQADQVLAQRPHRLHTWDRSSFSRWFEIATKSACVTDDAAEEKKK